MMCCMCRLKATRSTCSGHVYWYLQDECEVNEDVDVQVAWGVEGGEELEEL